MVKKAISQERDGKKGNVEKKATREVSLVEVVFIVPTVSFIISRDWSILSREK